MTYFEALNRLENKIGGSEALRKLATNYSEKLKNVEHLKLKEKQLEEETFRMNFDLLSLERIERRHDELIQTLDTFSKEAESAFRNYERLQMLLIEVDYKKLAKYDILEQELEFKETEQELENEIAWKKPYLESMENRSIVKQAKLARKERAEVKYRLEMINLIGTEKLKKMQDKYDEVHKERNDIIVAVVTQAVQLKNLREQLQALKESQSKSIKPVKKAYDDKVIAEKEWKEKEQQAKRKMKLLWLELDSKLISTFMYEHILTKEKPVTSPPKMKDSEQRKDCSEKLQSKDRLHEEMLKMAAESERKSSDRRNGTVSASGSDKASFKSDKILPKITEMRSEKAEKVEEIKKKSAIFVESKEKNGKESVGFNDREVIEKSPECIIISDEINKPAVAAEKTIEGNESDSSSSSSESSTKTIILSSSLEKTNKRSPGSPLMFEMFNDDKYVSEKTNNVWESLHSSPEEAQGNDFDIWGSGFALGKAHDIDENDSFELDFDFSTSKIGDFL